MKTPLLFVFSLLALAFVGSPTTLIAQDESDEQLPELQNGFYLLLGYQDGSATPFMADTFSLERNGDDFIMRPSNINKIKKPLKGFVDDDVISVHSREEACYGKAASKATKTTAATAATDGIFFFHAVIGKDTIAGHGSAPMLTDKTFKIKMLRIAIPLIDSRDGQHYKTVRIGNQFWMAENLRYMDTLGGIYVNPDHPDKIYGNLYSWESIDRVCPRGWHVPTREEWNYAVNYLGAKTAGTKMKSATGWGSKTSSGKDLIGFSAYPAGYYNPETDAYKDVGEHTFFWAIDQQNLQNSWYRNIFREYPGVYEFNDRKQYGLSCRCIQD